MPQLPAMSDRRLQKAVDLFAGDNLL